MSTREVLANEPPAIDPARTGARPRSILAPLLNLFSSVWLGVFLLTLLFVYTSIGSSGAPIGPGMWRPWFILNPDAWISVRQLRFFELSEFEWFVWWPFNLLIALICINIVVATLRRIPLNVVNLGVWMIHTGILILCAGGVWYFTTKVEGESPIIRRRLVASVAGAEPVSIPALPGSTAVVGRGDDQYLLQVASIDPRWELLSGDEKGVRAYKVSVLVQGKGGTFVRDLVANRPQYTQDLVMTGDPQQPMQRSIKVNGKPLVDEAITMSLDYDPQRWFYLADSHAMYLREVGSDHWIERPIRHLPRYNDYIASPDDVWLGPGEDGLPIDPVDVRVVAVDPNDPLPGVDFRVTRYLRYATIETRHPIDPAAPINPRATISMTASTGESQRYDLAAFDPQQRSQLDGNLVMVWANSPQDIEALKTRVDPSIRFSVPGSDRVWDEKVTALASRDPNTPFKPLEGTDYSFRVESLQDNVNINGKAVSIAIVQIKTPQRTYTRWVFDDPSLNRDMAMAADPAVQHDAQIETDAGLLTTYRKGTFPPAPIVLVAGPGEQDLAVVVTKLTSQPQYTAVKVGDAVPIVEGVTMRVEKYAPRTRTESKPLVVPREQRDRDMRELLSMIRVDVDGGASAWLPYHHFAFENSDEVLRRFPYRPTVVNMPDGRQFELMFSRARLPLPAEVVLDDFQVDTHIGGFTGQTSSIMDWKSLVRFEGDDGQWLPPQEVRVNQPTEFDGYWFFQAQWDPPDPPRTPGDTGSAGPNYTVLGVGNRNGVRVMLSGCCIAVFGMIYAFYCKPWIKRRRQQAVYAQVRERAHVTGHERDGRAASPQPAGVAGQWRTEP